MIHVDYDALERIIRIKGLSRRKLALSVGIDETQFASSFRRRSRMQPENVRSIAAVLEINPLYLLPKEENGDYTYPADVKAIEEHEKAWSKMVKSFSVDSINELIASLNDEGLDKACELIALLAEIPRYKKKAGEE